MDLKRYDAVLASADAYLARGKPVVEVMEIRGLARVAARTMPARSPTSIGPSISRPKPSRPSAAGC